MYIQFGNRLNSIFNLNVLAPLLIILTQVYAMNAMAADTEENIDPRVERIRQDLGYYSDKQPENDADAAQQRIEQLRKNLGYKNAAKKPALQPIQNRLNQDDDPKSEMPVKTVNIQTTPGNPESSTKTVKAELLPPIADNNYITHVEFENSLNRSSSYPVTFGQLFVAGDLPNGYTLKVIDKDAHEIPVQMDIKAHHQDGSVRHAVVSALIRSDTKIIWLYKSELKNANPAVKTAHVDFKPDSLQSNVSISLDGKNYVASLDKSALDCEKNQSAVLDGFCQLLAAPASAKFQRIIHPKVINWLNGAIVDEIGIPVYFQDEEGTAHPHLMARFFIRKYLNSNNIRLDLTIENNWTYNPNPQNISYDVNVFVNHAKVFSQGGLHHFNHARWRKIFWSEESQDVHIKHDARYLISTKAIPNYDQSLIIDPKIIDRLYGQYEKYPAVPMEVGPATKYMPQPGAHRDIGPLPIWTVHYLLTMDRRPKNITLATGDMAGSWSVHYRDHNTDLPVSLKDYPYLSTHANKRGQGPHPLPPCLECRSAFTADVAHEPSLVFVPYAVTGDYYYLEELQFWADWNVFETEPMYRGLDQGLVKWQQPRGVAWSLRTLGQAAYITPDEHPLKNYFVQQVHNNLDYYNTKFANNPEANKLGIVMGGGLDPQPWMQDFMTWSFGYLADLGFSDAMPILNWNAQFLINRFTNKDFCWLAATRYKLRVRNSEKDPIFTSYKDVYKSSVPLQARICNVMPVEQLLAMPEPQRTETEDKLMANCECNTQAMVDSYYGKHSKLGVMSGYPDGDMGFPSNMQPALAMITDHKVPMARESWLIFESRSLKPDFALNPIWDIVPREKLNP